MVVRPVHAFQPRAPRLVARVRRHRRQPWQQLCGNVGRERGGGERAPDEAPGGRLRRHVERKLEEVRVDRRRGGRVRALDVHAATREGKQHPERRHEFQSPGDGHREDFGERRVLRED